MSRLIARQGRGHMALVLTIFLLSLLAVVGLIGSYYRQPREKSAAPKDPAMPATEFLGPSQTTIDQLKIRDWHHVAELNVDLAQFETVFWEPDDTLSMRSWLSQPQHIERASVLEIGTGTGLVAVSCALAGAERIIATDINPNAYANAAYNAEMLGLANQIDVRLVPADTPKPFSVVKRSETFDLILSNPPWEDQPVGEVAAYALYDPGFQLLDALLHQSQLYLNPQGKLLLAYGAKPAIQRILQRGPELGWQVEYADERPLEELPSVFLPGVLLVLTPAHAAESSVRQ